MNTGDTDILSKLSSVPTTTSSAVTDLGNVEAFKKLLHLYNSGKVVGNPEEALSGENREAMQMLVDFYKDHPAGQTVICNGETVISDANHKNSETITKETTLDKLVGEMCKREPNDSVSPGCTAEATEVENSEALNKLQQKFLGSSSQKNDGVKMDVECSDFNYQLIQEVKRRPCLYDINDDTYNNNQMRASMWVEIANKFNTSSEFVKTRWKTMRDRYKKEEKRCKQGKHTTWSFFPELHFISPYLRARYPHDPEERNQLEGQPDEERASPSASFSLDSLLGQMQQQQHSPSLFEPPPKRERVEGPEAACVGPSGHSPLLTVNTSAPSPSCQQGSSHSRGSNSPPEIASSTSSSTHHNHSHSQQQQPSSSTKASNQNQPQWNRLDNEEDEIFGHMIAMKLNKLHPKLKEKAKIGLMKALYDVQYGE